MTTRGLIHEDDLVVCFAATQEARHSSVLRVNEMARAMVERSLANAVGQQADENGEVPGPAPLRIVLGFDLNDKSAKQRAFLHGPVLGQIAEHVKMPDGTRYVAQIWKTYFRKMFLPDTWEMRREVKWDPKKCLLVQAKRATPHRVRISTERLSVKQYSTLIDQVIAHATTELGVVFDLDPVERKAARYVRPPRRKLPEDANATTATAGA